jgi:hypothetical protein
MDQLEQKIESLKLLQDWSKWLITLEAGVCVLLWRVMAGETKPPIKVYVAWLMFWGSILAAAVLLVAISFLVQQTAASIERKMKILLGLIIAEYLFFLAGMIFLLLRVAEMWPTMKPC